MIFCQTADIPVIKMFPRIQKLPAQIYLVTVKIELATVYMYF